jgi:pilus assembly protein CpaE
MSTPSQYSDSLGADVLSIALIGPDERRRKMASAALATYQGGVVREFSAYPPSLDEIPKLMEQHYDVILIELDSDPEYALELVEAICATGSSTVMVHTGYTDSEMLVRCMRAGAREFFTLPFEPAAMVEALIRASVRRPATRLTKKAIGRLFVFLGAKGGNGVTTLASNFAVALAQETGQSTVLIDLDLPLGDVALDLGIAAPYSTVTALQDPARLDSNFLSKLLIKHSSGLLVLASPGEFAKIHASTEAIDRLLAVARQDFHHVVVDAGARIDPTEIAIFDSAATVYLVTEVSISALRNSNRLISEFFKAGSPNLEVVLNRYSPRSMEIDEEHIVKALKRPVKWRVPNDWAAARRAQNTATPLALGTSPISRLLHQMARAAVGMDEAEPKAKKGFSLFGG